MRVDLNDRLLVALTDITPKYVDEHIKMSVKAMPKHNLKTKYIIVAACLGLILSLFLAVSLFNLDGNYIFGNNFLEGLSDKLDSSSNLPLKNEEPISVIYRVDAYNGTDNNLYINPPNDGDVRIDINLFELLESGKIKENDVLAVRVRCVSSKLLDEQYVKKKTELTQNVVGCYLDYTRHAQETHSGESGQSVDGCSECKTLQDIYMSAEENFENDLKVFEENQRAFVNSMAIDYMQSIGYSVKSGTIVWGDPANDTEDVSTENYILVHLSKEQIISLTAPENIGLILEHAPSWMDTGESVIYHEPLVVID